MAEAEPTYKGRLLTAKQVAEVLGLDESTIRRWAKEGVFEAVYIGPKGKRQTMRIKGESLARLLGKIPEE